MTLQEQWQLSGSVPELYERYRVPRKDHPLALLLLERVPLRAGQRVLDVACGTGIVARLVAPRIAPTGTVVGLDLNEGMLAVARAQADGLAIEWKQADASALPFEEGAFDVVLCQQGLQFFPDKPAVLREMRRVLAAGGTLALNVWGRVNRYNAALGEGLSQYVDAKTATRSLAPFALGDSAALRALIEDAGFNGIDVRAVNLTRRVVPSQEWLLQDTAGMPFAAAIAAIEPAVRAQMVREIAAKLKDLWDGDSFAVPCEVLQVVARN